jgi:hypothetical protein
MPEKNGLEAGLCLAANFAYCAGMKYALAILAVLACLGAQGCAPATNKPPPDHVLDPRGQ